VTSASVSPPSPNGSNGWYVSAPQVTLSATAGDLSVASTRYTIDGGSEQTYSGPFSISSDGMHTVSYYSVDTDGNAEAAHSILLKVDLNNPTSSASISPSPQNGWYASPTVTLTGDDGAGSGIDHISYSIDGGAFQTYSGPLSGFSTGNHFVQFRAFDVAGRQEPSLNLIAFKADSDVPTVNIARPKEGKSFKLGQVVKASYKCADKRGGSGLQSCVGDVPNGSPIDTSTVGDHTFTVTATDKAGNVRTVVRHYHVRYSFQGFFAPVTNNAKAKLNLVHAGDKVKLSFSLRGNHGLSIGTFSSAPVSCPSWAPHSIKEQSLPTGLTYNASTKHYLYGWDTDAGWAGTCRELTLTLADGTVHRATFLFFA
jgi:hypothetical protein